MFIISCAVDNIYICCMCHSYQASLSIEYCYFISTSLLPYVYALFRATPVLILRTSLSLRCQEVDPCQESCAVIVGVLRQTTGVFSLSEQDCFLRCVGLSVRQGGEGEVSQGGGFYGFGVACWGQKC